MSRTRARVTYTKQSGESLSISFGNYDDAREYAEWLNKTDPGCNATAENLDDPEDWE